MKNYVKKSLIVLVSSALGLVSLSSQAMIVFDPTVNGTLAAGFSTLEVTLANIGTAINSSSSKMTAAITESAKTQREYQTYVNKENKLEAARKSFVIPTSICSESASGSATSMSDYSKSMESNINSGAAIKNPLIQNIITARNQQNDSANWSAVKIHANYCDAEDAKLYGSDVCKGISKMPHGDIEVNSLFNGAGSHTPDLTFSQDQIDTARMYTYNTTDVGLSQLSAGEINSRAGKQYVALYNQAKAFESAAREPQTELIAASTPNENMKGVLDEVLKTPSAKAYFDHTASPLAQKTHTMSEREFESFEVGRRYSNTDYLTDLQAMEGDNLTRENIRLASLNSWLLLGIKQQLQKNNVLLGEMISLQNKAVNKPILEAEYQKISPSLSR